MSTSHPEIPAASRAQQIALLAFFPALAFVVGFVFLPTPTTMRTAREGTDRSKLSGILLTEAPTPTEKFTVGLDKKLKLLGADIPTAALHRGSAIDLATYIEVLDTVDRDWKVFLHIDRKGGPFRIHGDHYPAKARYIRRCGASVTSSKMTFTLAFQSTRRLANTKFGWDFISAKTACVSPAATKIATTAKTASASAIFASNEHSLCRF